MKMVRELTLLELIFTATTMLKGLEGQDFCYYEEDEDWWDSRLFISRN